MAYGDLKDLARRDKEIRNKEIKHLLLLKILNTMDIKEVLLPWFTKGSGVATLANKSAFNNEQLAE